MTGNNAFCEIALGEEQKSAVKITVVENFMNASPSRINKNLPPLKRKEEIPPRKAGSLEKAAVFEGSKV